MAREFARAFYSSRRWKNCRAAYLKSVGGLCERCYRKGLIVPATMVHHSVYLSERNINNPHVTLNWNNLEALCDACHAAEHEQNMQKRRFYVDKQGNVISK